MYTGSEAGEAAFVGPAVNGTMHVLDAIGRAAPQCRTVVVTSSISAISSNAGLLPATHVYTDADWSPADRLKELGRWYDLAKTLAERAAWDHPLVKQGRVRLCTVCPGLVIGPVLCAAQAFKTPMRYLRFERGEWTETPNRGTVSLESA